MAAAFATMEPRFKVAPHPRSSASSTSSNNERPHTRRRMYDELLEPVPPLLSVCTTTRHVSRGTQASVVYHHHHHHHHHEQNQHRVVWNQRTISEQLQLSSVSLPSTEHSSFLPPPGHRVDAGDDAPLQAPRRQTVVANNWDRSHEEPSRLSEPNAPQPATVFSRQQSLLSLDNMSTCTELENLFPPSNRSVSSFGHGSTCSSSHPASAAMVPPHLLRLTSQSSARPMKSKLERQASTGADSWWSAGTCNSHRLYKPTAEIRVTTTHRHHHRSSSAASIASSSCQGRCRHRPTNPVAELMMCQQISSRSLLSCSSVISTRTTTSCCTTTTNVAATAAASCESPPNPPFGACGSSRHKGHAQLQQQHLHHHTSTTTTTTTTHHHHHHHAQHRSDSTAASGPWEDPSTTLMQVDPMENISPPSDYHPQSYQPPLPLHGPPPSRAGLCRSSPPPSSSSASSSPSSFMEFTPLPSPDADGGDATIPTRGGDRTARRLGRRGSL